MDSFRMSVGNAMRPSAMKLKKAVEMQFCFAKCPLKHEVYALALEQLPVYSNISRLYSTFEALLQHTESLEYFMKYLVLSNSVDLLQFWHQVVKISKKHIDNVVWKTETVKIKSAYIDANLIGLDEELLQLFNNPEVVYIYIYMYIYIYIYYPEVLYIYHCYYIYSDDIFVYFRYF